MTANPASPPLYRWRIHDLTSPWRKKGGGWRELSWRMTEADALAWAAKEGVEQIEKVEGSEEIRHHVGTLGHLDPRSG